MSAPTFEQQLRRDLVGAAGRRHARQARTAFGLGRLLTVLTAFEAGVAAALWRVGL